MFIGVLTKHEGNKVKPPKHIHPSKNAWAKQFTNQSEHENKSTGGIGVRGFAKHSADGIRSSKNAGAIVPPRGVPIPQNYTEKYSLQKTLVRYIPPGTSPAVAGTALHALIYTPSNRLILTVQVWYEPDNILATDPTFTVQPTWALRRMVINSSSGREVAASQFYPAVGVANLPDETIIPDAPELLRADIGAIDSEQFNTVLWTGTPVSLILQAKWEPDVQTIPRDELKRLYERCRINYGIPINIENTPAA